MLEFLKKLPRKKAGNQYHIIYVISVSNGLKRGIKMEKTSLLFEIQKSEKPVMVLEGEYKECRDLAEDYRHIFGGTMFIRIKNKSNHLYKVKERKKKGYHKDGIVLEQIY